MRVRLLVALLAGVVAMPLVAVTPAHATPVRHVTVTNSASFKRCERTIIEDAACADGSFLSFTISPPPTEVRGALAYPWPSSLYNETTGVAFGIWLRECNNTFLRILSVDTVGFNPTTGADIVQINTYQQGDRGEPALGSCNVVASPTRYRDVTWVIQGSIDEFGYEVHEQPGRLWYSTPSVFPAYGTPAAAGFHFVPSLNQYTALSDCLASPAACRIQTQSGEYNFIILFATGLENDRCSGSSCPGKWQFRLEQGGVPIGLEATSISAAGEGYEQVNLRLNASVQPFATYTLGQRDQHAQFMPRLPFLSQQYRFSFG